MSFNVTLRSPDGTENTVTVESDQYVLDAAEEQGIDLPYSAVLVLVHPVLVKL